MVLKDDIEAVFQNPPESLLLAQKILTLQSDTATVSTAAAAAQTTATAAVPKAFTPTTSGNWSPAPTTVQIALDQLAARVKALEP